LRYGLSKTGMTSRRFIRYTSRLWEESNKAVPLEPGFLHKKGASIGSSLLVERLLKGITLSLSGVFHLKVLWWPRDSEINKGIELGHIGFVSGLTNGRDAQLYVAGLLEKRRDIIR
jgi:hypothetical protein